LTEFKNYRSICPEREVILWAIRVDHQNEDRIRQILCDGVDWLVLKELAWQHNIIPLLYHRLKELHETCVLPEMDQFFRDHYQANMYRNLMSAHQILWILKLFSDQDIHAIPFKGMVLALQAYTTPDMRQCGDIDFLIREKDLPKLIEILTKSGFNPDLPFTKNLQASMVHLIMKSESFSAKKRIGIDVHWKISDIFSGYPATEEFFQNARTLSFFGGKVTALPLEDALIMLSAHGMKHFWHELRHVEDIIQMVGNNPGIDFELAFSKAKRLRCSRLLRISLHLASILGGIEYGPSLSSHLNMDPVSLKIAKDISRFHQRGEIPHPFIRLLSMTRSREHWLDALGFGIYAVFSYIPSDGNKLDIPRLLRPFYFMVRPLWHLPIRKKKVQRDNGRI
jgi:hypothetical protein